MQRRYAAGFTVIEMLIVVVIFGIMTMVALPKVARITTHARVNQAAIVVAHDLSVAVSNATRQRKPVRILRGADKKSIFVLDRVSGAVLSMRSLGPADAYSLDSVSFSATPVDILPNGFTSRALTVTLWSAGYSRQVTMSRAAWVRAP
jgi:prepilin-type N-terminal cleavage/methylation domain-containing protein